MRRALTEGIITLAVFLSAWLVLSEINWVTLLRVDEVTSKTEEKLGKLFWETFQDSEEENTNPFVLDAIDSLVTEICRSNQISRERLKVHILNKDEVNAFALPDGHLVIYTGLILNTDNPEELAGVIGHEIAHIQLNHVMKKLVKEIGLSVLISITGGERGPEVIKETARILSSSAFDRRLEREADIRSVDYLIEASINPEPFADFLYKLATEEPKGADFFSWISTHPESKDRAEYIIAYSKGQQSAYKEILTNETWNSLKDRLRD